MQGDFPINLLLVDDQPENLVALEAVLGSLGANLVKSTSGEEALRCLLHQDFAVILLDVQMPQMDGFEVATLIRQRKRSQDTPIIFLTAFSSSEQFMFKGYALGAVDYLIKPIASNVLLSKVAIFIELFKKTQALQQKTEILQQQTEALKRQTAQLAATNADLQMSEERFRLLSTCSPVGVFVTDTAGQFVYTNPRFQAICHPSVEQPLKQSWLEAVHPDDLNLACSTWETYLQAEPEYAQEVRFLLEDEAVRWISIRSARMLSHQGELLGHVGTVEDITERKRAEVANAQIVREQLARQEAETANRMKDEFIAVLSHELRTPLNAILGWSRMLKSQNLPPQKIDHAIDAIDRNASAQAKLIEDILDVSQIVRGKLQLNFQPVDLVTIAQSALETVKPAAEAKAIALTTNLREFPHLEVMGDALRLQQVIWNLLTNAVKFTPSQGKVHLHLSLETCPAAAQHPSAASTSPWVQLRITDSGVGIDPDFLPYVFERFRQADSSKTRAQGGLGLGLAIVRHLVEQHQGSVWVESPGPDLGATFTIAIPLLQLDPQPGGQSTEDSSPEAIAPLAGMPILVADDDADNRDFLSFLLEAEGAVVTVANSASEVLQRLNASSPAILLCDISMPDMDGYELIQTIRTQLPHPQAKIPAIAITAHASVSDQAQALAAGFQAHVPKPVDADVLIQAILRIGGASGDRVSSSTHSVDIR